MSRHKNRTAKGDQAKAKHQATYENWWMNKCIATPFKENGKPVLRKIVKVEYIGNSVYGVVELTLDNGVRRFVSSRNSFRPKKTDLKLSDDKETSN